MKREYSQHFLDTSDVQRTPEGTRYRCALCKSLFKHEDIWYIKGDSFYTQLCGHCCDNPQAQCFLPYYERMARGLVSRDEIANMNAIHDM